MKIQEKKSPNFKLQAINFLKGDDSIVYGRQNETLKTEPSYPTHIKNHRYDFQNTTASSKKSLNTCEDSQLLNVLKSSSNKKNNKYRQLIAATDRHLVDIEFQAYNQERNPLGYLITPNQKAGYNLKKNKNESQNIKISADVKNTFDKKLVKLGNNLFFEKGHSLKPQFTIQRRQALAKMDLSQNVHESFGEKESDPAKLIEKTIKQQKQHQSMLQRINSSNYIDQDLSVNEIQNDNNNQQKYLNQNSNKSNEQLQQLQNNNPTSNNEIKTLKNVNSITSFTTSNNNQDTSRFMSPRLQQQQQQNQKLEEQNQELDSIDKEQLKFQKIHNNKNSSEVLSRINSKIIPSNLKQIRSQIFKGQYIRGSVFYKHQQDDWGFKVKESNIKKNIDSHSKQSQLEKQKKKDLKLPKVPLTVPRDDIIFPEQYPVSYKYVEHKNPEYSFPKSSFKELKKDTPDTYLKIQKFYEVNNHGKDEEKEEGYQKHFQKMMKDINVQVNEEIKHSKKLQHPIPANLRNTPFDEEFAINFDREYRKKLHWAKKALNNLKLKIRDMTV